MYAGRTMRNATSKQKAWGGVVLFTLAALIATLWAWPSAYYVPQLVFYIVLTVNSYYSIKLHARVQPREHSQAMIDFFLTLAYLALALSLGQPILFPFCALVVFVLAPIKYALMLDKIPHPRHLRKKILIDLAGTILMTFALGLAITGSPLFAAWIMALINLVANIYYLSINPMYLLSEA